MKLFLYITNPEAYLRRDVCFHATAHEITIVPWIFAGNVELKSEVDDKKIRKVALDSIDKREKEIRADFELDLESVQERRQKLLAITHRPLEIA